MLNQSEKLVINLENCLEALKSACDNAKFMDDKVYGRGDAIAVIGDKCNRKISIYCEIRSCLTEFTSTIDFQFHFIIDTGITLTGKVSIKNDIRCRNSMELFNLFLLPLKYPIEKAKILNIFESLASRANELMYNVDVQFLTDSQISFSDMIAKWINGVNLKEEIDNTVNDSLAKLMEELPIGEPSLKHDAEPSMDDLKKFFENHSV